jgi:cathepsin D
MIKTLAASIFFALLSSHIACSESIQLPSGNRNGRVAVKSNPSPYGHLEYYRALKKYDIRPNDPDALHYDEIEVMPRRRSGRSGLRRRNSTNGEVSASIVPGAYGSAITVGEGEDAKIFNVQFDTGSGDFWVYSNLFLEPKELTANFSHTIYDPLNSTTAIPSGQLFSIQYGTGNASGVVFEDTVTIAGFELKNQSVEAALITDPFDLNPEGFQLDGIFGLYALGNTTVVPGKNTMILEDLFFSDGSPNEKVFTALLTRPGEGDGFYTFGFIDEQVVGNSTINYSPILPPRFEEEPPFWKVSTPFAVINGERIETKNQTAIIDTGTTLAFLPDKVLEKIYESVEGHFNETFQLWLFPDNFTESQLPSINLPVDGFDVNLDPMDIVFDNQSIPDFVIGGYQSSGGEVSIYGDVWLQNVYAIFDLGSGNLSDFRFGFVPRKPGVNN